MALAHPLEMASEREEMKKREGRSFVMFYSQS